MSFGPLDAHLDYDSVASAFITQSNDDDNLKGVRWIQATGAGDVVLRSSAGVVSVAIPLATHTRLPIGRSIVALHDTGTTATDIIAWK